MVKFYLMPVLLCQLKEKLDLMYINEFEYLLSSICALVRRVIGVVQA
jgi:hypothetical protein